MSKGRLTSHVNDEGTNNLKKYKKIVPTLAKQMKFDFKVETLEGIMEGKAGDYLCVGIPFEDEMWPVKREIFETTYEEVK